MLSGASRPATAGRLAFDFAAGVTARGGERSGELSAARFLHTVWAGQPVGLLRWLGIFDSFVLLVDRAPFVESCRDVPSQTREANEKQNNSRSPTSTLPTKGDNCRENAGYEKTWFKRANYEWPQTPHDYHDSHQVFEINFLGHGKRGATLFMFTFEIGGIGEGTG